MNKRINICLLPRLSGIGGMVSFHNKFVAGLKDQNIDICYDLGASNIDAILVIGGTRQLSKLWRAKRRGIPIVQRLDGMNWVHKVLDTGLKHRLRADYGNAILTIIRSNLADKIAYQSEFSRQWWERERGHSPAQCKVIHNAVDLDEFSPRENLNLEDDHIRILLVEGSLLGGYEFGLENAIKMSSVLAHRHEGSRVVELSVVGKVTDEIKSHWDNWLDHETTRLNLHWAGTVSNDRIADFYRNADIFSADINAACPNSVIESLACGTPVLAFDTGALRELIGSDGGVTVPYGGDPWQLEDPDIQALASGALEIMSNIGTYRKSSRKRAENAFNLDTMVENYLDLLLG